MPLKDHLKFLSQSVKRFKTTGSLVPSSPFLAKAMAWPLEAPRKGPWRILEVGPGTGAFTECLVGSMREKDRLECYELNAEFCGHLNQRIKRELFFQRRRSQMTVLNRDIRTLPQSARYDLVVCSLPFNNFTASLVAEIMDILYAALKPGASLVYFEYLLIRKAKSATSNRQDRLRLAKIEEVLSALERLGKNRKEIVWMNFPPALVRSLTKPQRRSTVAVKAAA